MTPDELEKATERSTNSLHELYARACEIHPLFQQGNSLQAAITLKEGYAEITKLVHFLFPADAGELYLCSAEPGDDSLEVVASWLASPGKQERFVRHDCWALRTGKVHWVDADCDAPFCNHVPAASSTSYLCVPMMAHGQALGVLHLRTGLLGRNQSNGKRTRLPEAKRRLALAVASHIALALANLRLREQLTTQATHDSLTGLFNRRLLEETLEREIRRASPGPKRRVGERGSKVKPVGMIMVDIDHFKQFNTDFGHPGGDAVLRRLGTLLRERLCRRPGDLAFRYGAGDEFTVILPGASLKNSQQRAEELRKEVMGLRVPHEEKLLRPVTVSIGVAAFPDHGSTPEAMIKAADYALFRAKEKGRNRVEIAGLPNQRRRQGRKR